MNYFYPILRYGYIDGLYNQHNGTPTNSVIEVSFSDQTAIGSGAENTLQTLVYTAEGGETSFHNDSLEGATVLSVTRDGLTYTPVTSFSEATKKEFIAYPATIGEIPAGTIVFHPGLPAMQGPEDEIPSEDVVVEYIPEGLTATGLTEPVTLDEVKNWGKIEVNDDDTIITGLITSAREYCEGYTNLSFAPRTVTAVLSNALGGIRLPYGPVDDVTIMYDYNDEEIISDNYLIRGITSKRIAYPACDYIKVVYTAGYSVLPKQLKTALLMQIVWMYQNRGDAELSTSLSPEAKLLLNAYRTVA